VDMLPILEVTIGIVLVYLILSIVCTSLLEVVIANIGFKNKNLRKAVERLLEDTSLADRVYNDPEIKALCGPKGENPSYIPTDVFARSVLNVATNGEWRKSGGLPTVLRDKFVELASRTGSYASVKTAEQKLGSKLVEFMDEAKGDIDLLQNKIELWFDRTNDRSKGWFNRRVNRWLVFFGFAVALLVNADTIQIFQKLSEDPELRTAAVSSAEEQIKKGLVTLNSDSENGPVLESFRKQVGEVAPFIGWSTHDPLVSAWENSDFGTVPMLLVLKFLGLLITAFAVSLGAPFWFNLLQKLLNIRKSVAAKKAEDITKPKPGEAPAAAAHTESAAGAGDKEPAYTGPMEGFAPTAATVNLGNAYWLANSANLVYETDEQKLLATIDSWGMQGHYFESKGQGLVDTQGFIAADDNAVIVAFRGTEPTRPGDIITDLKFGLVDAGDYGEGKIHGGFEAAIEAVWDKEEVKNKILEMGSNRQPVWFAGHSLGGALAVLAASRYENVVKTQNAEAKESIDKIEEEMEPDKQEDATLIGKRQKALDLLRGRVAGIYTIGQPRVGNEKFVDDFETRMKEKHVRIINNRDAVPRVPVRTMKYRHSGTVLYLDEFGRLHRDPGLWYRLLDTVVISKAEMAKVVEAGKDHNAAAYVDLLDKARKSTSALTTLAIA